MNASGETPGRGTRQGLRTWYLWVLASAIGGAVGGATGFVEYLGPIFLWGVALGTAQAILLRHYLPRGAAATWVLASFIGWFSGWVVIAVIPNTLENALERLALEYTGSQAAGTQALHVLVWVVFAGFQAFVLLTYRSTSPFLVTLWMLGGVVGGVLAVATSFYLTNAAFLRSNGGVGGYPGEAVTGAVALAGAGAIYGAATGEVLAAIIQNGVLEDARRQSHLPGWLPTITGLAAFLLLGLTGAFGLAELSQRSNCRSGEWAVYQEFPQYDGGRSEPDIKESGCAFSYSVTVPKEAVLAYYSEMLNENGWEVESEGVSKLDARRDDCRYRVEYRSRIDPGDSTSRNGNVLVRVSEEG